MKSILKALRAVVEGLKNEVLAFSPDSQYDKSQTQPNLADIGRTEIAAHALRGLGPSSARDEITLTLDPSSDFRAQKPTKNRRRIESSRDHKVARLSPSALTSLPRKAKWASIFPRTAVAFGAAFSAMAVE
jgi:hypothetical protein